MQRRRRVARRSRPGWSRPGEGGVGFAGLGRAPPGWVRGTAGLGLWRRRRRAGFMAPPPRLSVRHNSRTAEKEGKLRNGQKSPSLRRRSRENPSFAGGGGGVLDRERVQRGTHGAWRMAHGAWRTARMARMADGADGAEHTAHDTQRATRCSQRTTHTADGPRPTGPGTFRGGAISA